MASAIRAPRKQRTRQHILADLSVHYVEGFILNEGHTAQRLRSDYSYDLLLRTFDERGYAEPGIVYIQIKAALILETAGPDTFVFDIDVRDYNLWIREEAPAILVLYHGARKKAYWLAIQQYFDENKTHRPPKGAKTVRVRVPKSQIVNRRAIERIRRLKWEKLKAKLQART